MLKIDQLTFSYDNIPVLKNIHLSVEKGQSVAIIGESGCGKSTLLKLIYGQYDLDAGTISYDEKPIFGPKFNLIPGEDYIKYLAQDFDLMPFITVEENIGKFLSNIYKDRKAARVHELLEMVEMTEFAKVKAKFLSGGQQQRVAIARVLALEPEILLLDEPFSQIDTFRKNKLRRNLFQYLKEKNITCIMATHDSTDILAFADAVAIMKNGEIIQKGKPQNVYNNPQNFYTATLFDEVNVIPKYLLEADSDSDETVFLYPHQLKITENSKLKVEAQKSYFRGNFWLIEAISNSGLIVFFENENNLNKATTVHLVKN
ncbi:ABC transporter ATP-binding protein [Flavobacterium noncentrifugens]|uniref:ABC-type Fe3+/spermidine/putrescine transport systems, ATPase components n=1 Tax=Flavobacterium noncentrifugens TaxID=1128970 RepID=A0A1G8VDI4_9FLAO|nr:ABC transporter ATP-binding protein [Flavobacterium noncentrifugens]GEP50458.1 ABC transporter ATP-binding protein [Flavobacterium noncentrifugens]SDJ64156.1 ABC-type Fe3+/spermidine/putrescine transport systems, ATPase components [Flavobacterium noncentrifugens]